MNKELIQQFGVTQPTQPQDLRRFSAVHAQELWDNAVHLASLAGKPVSLKVENGTQTYTIGEGGKDAPQVPNTEIIKPKGTIYEAPSSPLEKPNNESNTRLKPSQKLEPQKPLKTHDRRGLTGFYKGEFYRNGVPTSKRKK